MVPRNLERFGTIAVLRLDFSDKLEQILSDLFGHGPGHDSVC